jgi:hypothetical protein
MADISTLLLLLTARARIEGDWLLIEYHATNRGSQTVMTYDGASGEPGQEYPDLSSHRGVFITYMNQGIVQIKRALVTPPSGKVTAVRIPALSRLLPGESRTVRFKLPLPLTEKSEFSPDFDGATYELRKVKSLQVCLGYMILPEGSTLNPFPENPQAFKVVGSHGAQREATATVEIAVTVRFRTDGQFHRL